MPLKKIAERLAGRSLGTMQDRPDGFSEPPEAIDAQPPGTILRSFPIALPPGSPPGSEAVRILYTSTDDAGHTIAVTGLAYLPPGPAPRSGRLVVTYGHGAVGVSDGCAPSRFPIHPPFVPELLSRNVVVVASDYEGLGTTVPHRYLAGPPAARSMLDAARAARALPDSHTRTDVCVVGVSAGGHAALWTAELAARYAPELTVVGTAAVSPVGELRSTMARFSQDIRFSHYALMLTWTWRDWTPELRASSVFPSTAHRWLSELDRRCPGTYARILPTRLDEQLLADWWTEPAWNAALARNSPGNVAIRGPVLVVHGTRDSAISNASTDELVGLLERAGDRVSRLDVDADHGTVVHVASHRVLTWIDSLTAQ